MSRIKPTLPDAGLVRSRLGEFSTRYRLHAGVVLICLLFTATLWAGLYLQLQAERERIIESKRQENDNLARVFEEHVARTIRAAEVMLQEIDAEYQRHGLKFDLVRYAKDRGIYLDPYNILSIVDENGDLILANTPLSGPVSLRNTDSYQHHARHDTPGIFISLPRTGSTTGKWTVYLTRRINKADGSFGGMASVGIDPGYFSRIYTELDLGKDAIVSVIGRDGIIRARSTGAELTAGQNVAGSEVFTKLLPTANHGSFIRESLVDRITRINSYRALKNYPLIVLIGTSQAVALADYEKRRSLYVQAAGAMTVVILGLGLIILFQIAKSKRAEATQAQLAAIVEDATVAIFTRKLDGTILSWNPGAEKMLGYTAAETIGKPITFTRGPGQPLRLARNNEKLLRGEVTAHESDRITKDGRVISVLSSHSPIRDSAGNVVGASVIMQDISERKRAEETQAQLAAIIEGSNDAIIGRALDAGGTITSWNAAAERIFGYAASEAIGQPISILTPPKALRRVVNNNQELLRGIVIPARETERVTKDGRIISVILSLSPVRNEAGEVVSVALIIRDISELKQSQETQASLAAIVENANDAIVGRALDSTITSWNRAAERLFGWSAREAIGQSITLIVPPQRRGELRPFIERVIRGETLAPVESLHCHRDGSLISTSVTFSPTRDATGKVVSLSFIYRDITSRKRDEEVRARLAAIVETSIEAIISRDLDDKILSWNTAAERLFGYAAEEAIGQSISMIIPPDRMEEVARNRAFLAQGRDVMELETVRLAKSGRRIDVSLSQSPINDQYGVMAGVALIFRDITERKRAEETQARLAAIVENASDAIIGRALDGTITSWNAAAERLYGYSAAEAIGSKLQMAPPDLQHEVTANREQLAGGKTVFSYETARVTKDGRRIEVSRSMSPIKDKNGNTIGMAAIVRDITERKQAEAQLRLAASVFDNALDGIIITDENFRIEAVNRAFTAITGYAAAEAIGNSPRMLRSGHHDDEFYQTMRHAISDTGNWQGEIWDKRKNGDLYCEHLSISAVRGERGEITNYCAVFADITPRKTAETELLRLNAELEARVAARTQELERANRELETFSYSVSHDLRAPLRHILGFSAMVVKANEGKLSSASIDHLGKIAAGAQRMAELIDDLLQLSHISRQEMRWRPFNLSELSAKVIQVLAQAHPQRNVEVVIAPAMTIEGDRGLMQIAMENLLGNAWKFTSHTEHARIEVGCTERDGEPIYFVRDNGAGFDMKYAAKLFGAFQRLHSAEEFEGSGIGLSIVQRIIVRHAGRVWVEAAAGEGATFYFTLGKITQIP